MLEDQPLDLSVRVGDYAEYNSSRDENDHEAVVGGPDHDNDERKLLDVEDFGDAAALRLRGLAATVAEYSSQGDRTCSEDSDDSCSDNNAKNGSTRARSRPPGTKPYKKNLMRRYLDTREVQPHDTGEKEVLGLAIVKAEPGSTTGARLLHGILSQHPQQHGIGLQNGYGRHLNNPAHGQIGQQNYSTGSLATTNTPGGGSLPASPADSGVSDVESSTSSGGNDDANLLLKARLNPNSALQSSLASHHSHLTTALGRSACHSPGVYPTTGSFLAPSYHHHHHQHTAAPYHPHRSSPPHHHHGNHGMGPAMGPPPGQHHHHHHQHHQSLQHLHYRQPPTCVRHTEIEAVAGPSGVRSNLESVAELAETAATESFGKLSLFDMMCTPEEQGSQSEVKDEFVFVHSSCWTELFKNFACSECTEKTLGVQVREQKGFCAKLVIKCQSCGYRMGESYTSPRTKDNSKRPPFEINRRVVDGMIGVGLGHSSMEKFCTIMSMKGMSVATFKTHVDQLTAETGKLEARVLQKARKAVRKAHEAVDPTSVSEEVLDIAVSYDGTWHKRGFTSLYGVGIVIDILTGLAIDYQVLSKYCQMCVIVAAQLDATSPDFAVWQLGHRSSGECNTNYNGSSGAMETKAAEHLWNRSIEKNQMRYTTILSDGDAKTFSHLQSIAPYGENVPVTKEECVNHIAKRMGTGLRKLVKEWKIKGVSLGGRTPGSLKETTIVSLTNYYRHAIIKNIPNIPAMKKAIHATIRHCMSTDENPQHSECPTGPNSWCFYNKSEADGEEPGSHENMRLKLNATVVEKITPLYERLSTDNLLARCARGATQNANESLHSLIWRKCPKETFISKKRIELAVATAVAEFNMGAVHAQKAKMSVRSAKVTAIAKTITEQRDMKRRRQGEQRATTETKKARRTVRIKKNATEKAKGHAEGATYGAGEF